MVEQMWKAKKADLIVEEGGTAKNVGGLQDAEIEFSFDINTLDAQSIKPLDREVTAEEINVSATYAKFDMVAIESITKYDSTAGEITDSPELLTFIVRGEFIANDGSEEHIEVKEVGFDSITLPWGSEEWVTTDISGTGYDYERITP